MTLKIPTDKILLNSLKSLLETKELSEITVTDIVTNCNASRSVFYKYFRDKYDLANYEYQHFISELTKRMKIEHKEINDYTLETLNFIYKNRHFYSQLARDKSQNSFFKTFSPLFITLTTQYIESVLNTTNLADTIRFSIQYHGAAHAQMVQNWILNNFQPSPQLLATLITENAKTLYDKVGISTK